MLRVMVLRQAANRTKGKKANLVCDSNFEVIVLLLLGHEGGAPMIRLDNVSPQYITDEKGKKKSVILPISKFQELIEDIEDLAAVAERRDEPTMSHKKFLAELKDDGLI